MTGEGLERLHHSDLRLLVNVTSSVVELESLDDYRHGVVGELRRLIPGDIYGYNEIEPDGAPAYWILDPEGSQAPNAEELFPQFALQNPLIVRCAEGDARALKWSDFLTQKELHRTEIYDYLYKPQGAEAQIACGLPATDSRVLGLAVNRHRGDFTERDRAMLALARPAFVQAYRAAVDRALLQALLDAPVATGGPTRGVILLSEHATVERATPPAWRWLDELDRDAEDRLPRSIADWVGEQRRSGSTGWLRTGGPGGAPSIRFVPGSTASLDALVVRWPAARLPEETQELLGLTSREFEVLRLVERGRSNVQIALELGIKEDTVAKHLQHVYEKLGVASRTEAVHRAAELTAAE